MNLTVLISCMHQHDFSIVERTNVQTDCIVINQCSKDARDEYRFRNKKGRLCNVVFISTTTRGLSKSRNLAIAECSSDLCLICDDDERLDDNYEDTILNAYLSLSKADVIAFAVERSDIHRSYPTELKKLGFVLCHRTSSVQISFNPKSVLKKKIVFDEKIGSGTGNGPCEDTKWLLDCWRKRLNAYFFPANIAKLNDASDSNWFHGYDRKYHLDRGYCAKRCHGYVLGIPFLIYELITHRDLLCSIISFPKALFYNIKGFFQIR